MLLCVCVYVYVYMCICVLLYVGCAVIGTQDYQQERSYLRKSSRPASQPQKTQHTSAAIQRKPCFKLSPLCQCFFWLIPSITFAMSHFSFLFVPPSSGISQIRGHYASSSPPSPLRYTPKFKSRQDFSPFFPRLLASICAPVATV